ncbi:MAG: hypothetical protein AABW53_03010 [Nanoarchaeota archaeon]
MMEELELSLEDFEDYHERNKLGYLYLPNGSMKIDMERLYSGITTWRIGGKILSAADVTAVIAFGSAVRYPGFTEHPTITKKYWLFGPAEKSTIKVPIEPNDVDFLIVTRENLDGETFIFAKTSGEYGSNSVISDPDASHLPGSQSNVGGSKL